MRADAIRVLARRRHRADVDGRINRSILLVNVGKSCA